MPIPTLTDGSLVRLEILHGHACNLSAGCVPLRSTLAIRSPGAACQQPLLTEWRRVLTWHTHAMARTRLSTTVDADLLDGARRVRSGVTDATLIDEALQALLVRYRAAEVDVSYAAYDAHPLDEPDEWGDLASFRQASAAS